MGVPLINFFKKLGVSPNHQIFRLRHRTAEAERGYPQFKKKTIRGTPIFFPEKQTFLFSRSGNLITLTVVTFTRRVLGLILDVELFGLLAIEFQILMMFSLFVA